ncbi:MAG TPA: DinB family protein [Candidatus Acidoferrales bacterium]
MNIDDIRLLYDFNAWANHRTIDACAPLAPEQFTRDLASSFRSVRDTLAHIYGAQWVWLERWHGRIPTALPATADFPNLDTVRRRFIEIDRNLVDFAASLNADDLHRIVQYKTVAGTAQAQPLWQMLQHVANHSTYHRGQVTTLLRQLGAKATSTDLIAFYRERATQTDA